MRKEPDLSLLESRERYLEWYERNSHYSNQHVNEDWARVAWALPYLTSSRVLEVGCQWGGVTRIIAERASYVHAVDITDEHVSRTRRFMSECGLSNGVTVENKWIEDLVGTVCSFDCVLLFEILEHVQDDRQVLENCISLTRSEGTVLITVPFEDYFQEEDHLRQYSVESMQKLLGNFGQFYWLSVLYEPNPMWIAVRIRVRK